MREERRQNLAEVDAETDRGSYCKQEKWLEAFLDDKSAFSDGSEGDDSDNDKFPKFHTKTPVLESRLQLYQKYIPTQVFFL